MGYLAESCFPVLFFEGAMVQFMAIAIFLLPLQQAVVCDSIHLSCASYSIVLCVMIMTAVKLSSYVTEFSILGYLPLFLLF